MSICRWFVILVLWSQTALADQVPYCMAIRGNGDYQPHHWGAMAAVVERLGLPTMMAGGSSASISMFLLDSMSRHPMVKSAAPERQKEYASLMLKSLMGYAGELRKSPVFVDAENLYKAYQSQSVADLIAVLRKYAETDRWSEMSKQVSQLQNQIPFNEQLAGLLLHAVRTQDAPQLSFLLSEMEESRQVFGKFDARNDVNLFFRMPLVSFSRLAAWIGSIGGFYSADGVNLETLQSWTSFLTTCAPDSIGKSWPELLQRQPQCHALFSTLFATHFKQVNLPQEEDRDIGSGIPVLPATAVLQGSAAAEYRTAFDEYLSSRDSKFGERFQISNTEDIRFGYWGRKQDLTRIEANVDRRTEKSRRFTALGGASWKQVMTLSPAEPGLSNFVPFKTEDGRDLVSAGGWPDLAPTLVLKAAGCESTVFISREGGDSLFAQGVAKRLLNLEISWDRLDTSTPELSKRNSALNDAGDPSDLTSNWAALYNMALPESSLRTSIRSADAILCTDWNNVDPKEDIVRAVESSYRSPFALGLSAPKAWRTNLRPLIEDKKPGCY